MSNQVRSSYIYVQRSTRRRLHLLAGAQGNTTPDQIADDLLNEIIESKYPGILQTEKQIMKLEAGLAELLRKGKNNDAPSTTENANDY